MVHSLINNIFKSFSLIEEKDLQRHNLCKNGIIKKLSLTYNINEHIPSTIHLQPNPESEIILIY